MVDYEKLCYWIESGKQLGKIISFKNNGNVIWSSIAIQKCLNIYRVYIDEIYESDMASGDYLREGTEDFNSILEAFKFINENTQISQFDLRPCKGQKIFNPNFD